MHTVVAERGEGVKIGALKLANAGSIPGRSEGTMATTRAVAWGPCVPAGSPRTWRKTTSSQFQRYRWRHAPASRLCRQSASEEASRGNLRPDEDRGRVLEDALPSQRPRERFSSHRPRGRALQRRSNRPATRPSANCGHTQQPSHHEEALASAPCKEGQGLPSPPLHTRGRRACASVLIPGGQLHARTAMAQLCAHRNESAAFGTRLGVGHARHA